MGRYKILMLTEEDVERIESWYLYNDSYNVTTSQDFELLCKIREPLFGEEFKHCHPNTAREDITNDIPDYK